MFVFLHRKSVLVHPDLGSLCLVSVMSLEDEEANQGTNEIHPSFRAYKNAWDGLGRSHYPRWFSHRSSIYLVDGRLLYKIYLGQK